MLSRRAGVVPRWAPLVYILTLGNFAPFCLPFMALRHTTVTAVCDYELSDEGRMGVAAKGPAKSARVPRRMW
ncbi:MAG: hypothetical protein CVT68_07625 [Actinobacteria bacterium HGW-Actinobacteria-8]|nr:MAG: hypothetical protein CVT68_07625 [Actinobacteria bacterium HGW-Actinobacteria-8]